MAAREVSGWTPERISKEKEKYHESPKYKNTGTPFETAYCLTRIGKQPDDYDGPTRYCGNRAMRTGGVGPYATGHAPSCRFHGGTCNGQNAENLTEKSAMKHGMYATDEHLREEFTEQDQKLYDWVMSWADAYGWPSKEEDPSRYDDLEAIALNRVRVARSHKYILEEGEMDREEVYDENGNLREVTNPHGLSEDVRLKRKLITDLKKELGITPKERARMDAEETKAGAAETVAEIASTALTEDDRDYDPEDPLFEE